MDTNGRERAWFLGSMLTNWVQHAICPAFHLKLGWNQQPGLDGLTTVDCRLDLCLQWVKSCLLKTCSHMLDQS
jgi:hypothetical protein